MFISLRTTVEVEETTTCETLENMSKEDGNKLSYKKDHVKIIEHDSTEKSGGKQPTGKGTEEGRSEDIKSKKKGQRLKISDIESTEDPDAKVSPPAKKETGNKILGNTKSKKNGQRVKIEEIDSAASGSDVMQPRAEETGEGSVVKTGSFGEKEAVKDSVKPGVSKVVSEVAAKDAGMSTKDTGSVNEVTKDGSSADVVKEGDSVATVTTMHDTFAKPDEVPAKDEVKVVLEIPDKVKSLTEEGNQLYKIGHYAEALKKFSKSVDHLWKGNYRFIAKR